MWQLQSQIFSRIILDHDISLFGENHILQCRDYVISGGSPSDHWKRDE